MMKRIVMLLVFVVAALVGSVTASAQYSDVYRKGANLYSGDIRLTPEQVYSLLENVEGVTAADWDKARKGFNAGKGMLIGFGSLTGAGLLVTGVGVVGMMVEGVALGIGTAFVAPLAVVAGEDPEITYNSKFRGVAIAGLCATGVGVLGIAAGTTVYCVYKKRMNNIADACNAVPSASLSFGMQRHGVGLALNF